MKISIALPVYEMKGLGEEMLERCLASIVMQDFKEFEVVISDNCADARMMPVIRKFPHLPIHYFKNENRGATKNTNFAMQHCTGRLIHILNQDDYFATHHSLGDIVSNFKGFWMISGCSNNPIPIYTGDIHKGNNKLGSPSCLTIRNHLPYKIMLFDEDLNWLFDCDYYKRMYLRYGEPTILPGVIINIGTGDYQITNGLSQEEKQKEVVLMHNRYA